jgi:hypothetical protein
VRSVDGAGVVRAYAVDVNLLATAVPLAAALQPAENVASMLMLGAPDI